MLWKRLKRLFVKVGMPNYAKLDNAIMDAMTRGVHDMNELAGVLGFVSVFDMWKWVGSEEVQENIRVRAKDCDRKLIEDFMRKRLFGEQPVVWTPAHDRRTPVNFPDLNAAISHFESSLLTYIFAGEAYPKLSAVYVSDRPHTVRISVMDSRIDEFVCLGFISELTKHQALELDRHYNG